MASFLYTWNPKLWNWVDLQNAIYRVNNEGLHEDEWSCGRNKNIHIGDMFFLMRLGAEPKGIVGFGYIVSTPYLSKHWDEEKAKMGKETLRTNLLFKVLSEKPIFSLPYLESNYSDYKWTPHSGGLSIPNEISSKLFADMQKTHNFAFNVPTQTEIEFYSEGKIKEITVKTYDRSPIARQICIEHYGYNCAVCDFNFGRTYGKLGEKYIEVHHLKQLADIGEEYKINPIDDLRPVCANCHRMLHKERPPLSIEELKAKIST